MFGEFRPQPAGWDQGIRLPAFHGAGGNLSGEAVVDGGAQAVQVAPRTLTVAAVLLIGGESLLEHGGHGDLALDVPGAAEVHEFHSPVAQKHQIVRTDVPVDDVGLVHGLHGTDHRFQQGEQHLGGARPLGLGDLFQSLTLQKLHNNVGGVVLREKVQHPHHLGDLLQSGHGPGLSKELLPALCVGLLAGGSIAGHIQGH